MISWLKPKTNKNRLEMTLSWPIMHGSRSPYVLNDLYKTWFSVSCYTTAHTEDSAYFFGGYGGQSKRVARYYNDDWTEKGTMIQGTLVQVFHYGLKDLF